MNAVIKSKEDELIRWVTFRLADEIYGINVMQVQEVLRMSEVAPVPGAPSYVLGIINLRGNVVTVLDTRMLFGLMTSEVTDNTRIMIVECDGIIIGLLVDSVAEVANILSSEIDAAPHVGSGESSRYILGVHSKDGDILILVDLDKLISEEDRQAFAN